jgi:hypothetical protein
MQPNEGKAHITTLRLIQQDILNKEASLALAETIKITKLMTEKEKVKNKSSSNLS